MNENTPGTTEFTPEDQKLLEHCEVTIQTGVKNFLAVGQALSTIREKRLYKLKGSDTFEDYCQTNWNITRQYASQLILTFRLNEDLSTDVDTPVIESPHMAKRFRKLPPEEQEELAEKVAAGSDLGEELEKVEEKKTPSEFLRARKLSVQLWELLQSSNDREKMVRSISDVVDWITDYLETKDKQEQQRQKEAGFEAA